MANIELTDVPETMLWTLHNRAVEARRPDAYLRDPEAVRIYETIDYDYERSFGPAEPSHAVRSAMFDRAIEAFLAESPNGVVVNLGEGLETQRFRVEGDAATWLTVDLPEAIAVRERFMQPDDAHHHIGCSALDRAWFDAVPPDRPVFVTAQGLMMYLREADVRSLLVDIGERFPGARVMFDTIPTWLSRKTMGGGWKKTEHYTTPPMPWGIDRHDVESTLRAWLPDLASLELVEWDRFPRGPWRWLFPVLTRVPLLRRMAPLVVRLQYR